MYRSEIGAPMVAFIIIIIAVILLFFLSFCSGKVPTQEEGWWMPFLPPTQVWEKAAFTATEFSDGKAESVDLNTPGVSLEWDKAGDTSTESIFVDSRHLLTIKTEVGYWEGEKFRVTQYFPTGVVEGCVRLTRDLSIIGIFADAPEGGHLDVSKLEFCYSGGTLAFVRYTEQWGVSHSHPVALGGVAVWDRLPAGAEMWREWGFWGDVVEPYEILSMIDWWRRSYYEEDPGLIILDQDAPPAELIGRQPGATISGKRPGNIELEYRETWGCQPLQPMFGKGALSRVVVRAGDEVYTIWVVSSRLSPSCTAWMFFYRGDVPMPQGDPVDILPMARELGPFLSLYITGSRVEITGKGETDEGDSVTVTTGKSSGVSMFIPPATPQALWEAIYALDMLGPATQVALGWGFPGQGGMGLRYLLTTVALKYPEAAPVPIGPDLIDQPGILYPRK